MSERKIIPWLMAALLTPAAIPDAWTGGARLNVHEAARPVPAAHAVLDRALAAMGGRALLAGLHSLKLSVRTVGYRLDDSERADGPYWLDIGIGTEWIDETHGRSRLELDDASAQWPLDLVKINSPEMTVQSALWQGKRRWSASVPSLIESAALQPERILLTAAAASDLRILPDHVLHHQLQHVLALTYAGHEVRLYVDAMLYLPSRLELLGARAGSSLSVMQGNIVWDVDYLFYKRQPSGLVYPHQIDLTRNHRHYKTTVIAALVQDAPPPTGGYEPPASAGVLAPDPKGIYGSEPIRPQSVRQLARDVWLIRGSWNVMLVRQPDGIVVIEAPESSAYSMHVLRLLAQRFPGVAVKAVISTTDSTWHIAGVRTYVARGIPVYVLDANEARLLRFIESPHTLDPDELTLHAVPARLIAVHDATAIGNGPTQLTIYPIRGHGDERMMMVYFPRLQLLYGSSNDYNPEQKPRPRATFNAFEVVRRVAALRLRVRRFVAIHTEEMPWPAFRHTVLSQPAISSG